MKKLGLLFVAFFVLAAKSCGTKDESVLIVGTSADYPPFEYKIGDEFVGFDVELMQLIGKELGKKIEFKDCSFGTLLASVSSGQIDAVIASLGITAERQQNFDMSRPYFFDELVVLYPVEKPLIGSASFAGKKIGCQMGSTMEMWLKQEIAKNQALAGTEVVSMDSNLQLVEALKAGLLDGVLIGTGQVGAFCTNNPGLAWHACEHAPEEAGYGILTAKDSALSSQINAVIAKLESSGQLADLKKKWLGGVA